MHNVLFVLIWPLTVICALLPRHRLVIGLIVFLACQMFLWHTTMQAMNSLSWDKSVGDAFVPITILMPVALFVALIAARLFWVVVSLCNGRDGGNKSPLKQAEAKN